MAAQPKTPHYLFYALIAGMLLFVFGFLGYLFYTNLEPSTKQALMPTKSAYVQPETPVADAGVVTVWAWNTAAKSLRSVAADFNKVYPNIKVDVVEIPYNEANDKFRLAISTGTGFPDVWDSEGPVTYEYIRAGALEDITDKVSKYKNDFVAYKWAEVSEGDRIFGLPWDTAPAGLFYRKDLFEQAGVDPNQIETWDDFIEAGKRVTRDTDGDGKIDQYMTLMSRKSDVQDTFQILQSQFGGSLFDANGKPSMDTQAGRDSIVLMKKIIDSGIAANVGWWTPEFFEGIKTGNLASLPQGVWMGGQIKEIAPDLSGKWGVIPLPAAKDGGVRSAIRGGSNLAIPAKAKNKTAAWQFIEFALANKESQLKMYKEYNIFPALKAAYSDPIFNEANAYFGNQLTSQLFIKAQEELPLNFYYGANYTQATNILSKNIIDVLNGVKTPQQALQDTQNQILSRQDKR